MSILPTTPEGSSQTKGRIPRLIRVFVFSAGVLLLLTAAAKIISALGGARILGTPDPVFGISFRKVFWIVGSLELAAGLACFFGKRVGLKAGLMAWLATNFVAYRIGMLWVGYNKPCSCLGNLTDVLHISPQTADNIMKAILAYLLIGSYLTLFWVWRNAKRPSPALAPAIVAPPSA